MRAVDRGTEPPLGIGRMVLLLWISVSSVSLIGTSNTHPFFRIVGFCALAIAVVGIVWFAVTRARYAARGGAPAPRAVHRAPDELDGLRSHSDIAANRVLVALDLLRGPLTGLLDPTQIATARKAIYASLDDLATVDRSADAAATATTALRQSLEGSDIDLATDSDWQELQDHTRELEKRQGAIVRDLSTAASNLQTAWEPIEQDQLRQLHRSDLAKARDAAEHVIAGDSVRADVSARLSDAVDEIRARLRGVDEVGSINEKILGEES
ncbi:hypothetical protein ABIB25_003240 [Nakamurella sp. UYEF19]|uniref:hypothetical protein n=1 Tax=Nakamurella sp. UYEF19 TaxID=1756392 RepID=UPI003395DF47